jgi:hypothetical protein
MKHIRARERRKGSRKGENRIEKIHTQLGKENRLQIFSLSQWIGPYHMPKFAYGSSFLSVCYLDASRAGRNKAYGRLFWWSVFRPHNTRKD